MTRILVPLDGSELAQRAVPFALSIATQDGGSIRLLRAVNTVYAPTHRESQLTLDEATAELDAYAATVAGDVHVTTVVVDAPAEVAILQAAEDPEIDLIVMSTHGRSGIGRWVYGSVADAVLREAPVPVLIVPPHGLPRWPDDVPQKILVPLDGSALAMAAVQPAVELADRLGATIALGSVVTFPNYSAYAEGYVLVDPSPTENALAVSREYLQDVAATIRTETRRVEVSATFGSPFYGVAMMAADLHASLIVMATHGRSGIVRAVLGSVATATLRQSEVPILLVRPDEAARAAAGERAETPAATAAAATPPAVEASPPATEPAAAGINLTLAPEELDALILALGDRFHNEPVDPHHAEPTRLLLAKLRAARPATQPQDMTVGAR